MIDGKKYCIVLYIKLISIESFSMLPFLYILFNEIRKSNFILFPLYTLLLSIKMGYTQLYTRNVLGSRAREKNAFTIPDNNLELRLLWLMKISW